MSDLISRQAAIDAIVNRETIITRGKEYLDGYAKCQHDILDIINQLPSAEPERKTGTWIDDNCSVCGQYVHHGDARNYCPKCGAKMEGEDDD